MIALSYLVFFVLGLFIGALIKPSGTMPPPPDGYTTEVELTCEALRSFKNFHRVLCERFAYVHDENDWHRDQLSLIEHIAAQVKYPLPNRER